MGSSPFRFDGRYNQHPTGCLIPFSCYLTPNYEANGALLKEVEQPLRSSRPRILACEF